MLRKCQNIKMKNDFDHWNSVKQDLNIRSSNTFAYPREVWWCSLGINIGAEINGKNENFERPVIILKVYNKETMLILPLTTKEKNDTFHHKIQTERKTVWVKLTQSRVISNHRLLRKVDVLGEEEFSNLKIAWKNSL